MNPTDVPSWDAHNHVQSIEPSATRERWMIEAAAAGVRSMLVNGTCESDWDAVAELARTNPGVIPSFGYHPWRVSLRSTNWIDRLRELLAEFPSAGVGEIGIDGWILEQDSASLTRWGGRLGAVIPAPMEIQDTVFLEQLALATELNRPASIHCIQAWGHLLELLQKAQLPSRGFLLHSYGGSRELVKPFSDLGARFGFSGALGHLRKQRQLAVFRSVPLDRLLIETDAPHQLPPPEWMGPFADSIAAEAAQNHPGTVAMIQNQAAQFLGQDLCAFSAQMERNYINLFGSGVHT
jgi:TatD DNase family protein